MHIDKWWKMYSIPPAGVAIIKYVHKFTSLLLSKTWNSVNDNAVGPSLFNTFFSLSEFWYDSKRPVVPFKRIFKDFLMDDKKFRFSFPSTSSDRLPDLLATKKFLLLWNGRWAMAKLNASSTTTTISINGHLMFLSCGILLIAIGLYFYNREKWEGYVISILKLSKIIQS